MKWLTIDSAPTDGSPVLLYCPDGLERSWGHTGPNILITIGWFGHANPTYPSGAGHWVSTEVQSDIVHYGEYTGSCLESEQIQISPTHWMPLPAPPENNDS